MACIFSGPFYRAAHFGWVINIHWDIYLVHCLGRAFEIECCAAGSDEGLGFFAVEIHRFHDAALLAAISIGFGIDIRRHAARRAEYTGGALF